MNKVKYTIEQIQKKVKTIDRLMAQGNTIEQALAVAGISERQYYDWKEKYRIKNSAEIKRESNAFQREYLKEDEEQYNLKTNFYAIRRMINYAVSYLSRGKGLCNYSDEELEKYYPHKYNDPFDRACYIVRYIYAYAYEYFQLYKDLLELIGDTDSIKVLSLGCGSMVDSWSLQEAAFYTKCNAPIEYIGIDIVDWDDKYKPDISNRISRTFKRCKAGDYLSSLVALDFDIIVFPKSFEDIYRNDRSDFNKIKQTLSNHRLDKDCFYIAYSLVKNERTDNYEDYDNMNEIAYSVMSNNRNYTCGTGQNMYSNSTISSSVQGLPSLGNEMFELSKDLTGRHYMNNRSYELYKVYRFKRNGSK